MNRQLHLAIVLAAALASTLVAQRPATGGYPGAFMRYGANARDVALGGAIVADINSGFLALGNPASVVHLRKREFGLSYLRLPLGRSIQSIALAIPLPPTAALGISYLRAADESIQGRNSIGQLTGTLTYSEQVAGLTFSNRLSKAFSFGLTAKLLLQTLAGESSSGFAIDMGLQYRHAGGLSLALRAENITGAYNWRIPVSEGAREYSERFPKIISAGLTVPARHWLFLLQADAFFPFEGGMVNIYRAAVEDRISDQTFVRIGMNHLTPSAGVGFLFSLKEPLDSRVDYSLSLGRASDGIGHLFSWVFSL